MKENIPDEKCASLAPTLEQSMHFFLFLSQFAWLFSMPTK